MILEVQTLISDGTPKDEIVKQVCNQFGFTEVAATRLVEGIMHDMKEDGEFF